MTWLATHARWVLVAGLVAGVLFPGIGALLTPHLRLMVVAILALAAFRIGPELLAGLRGALARDLGAVLALQLGMPIAVILAALGLGVGAHPLVFALALMLAAPPIMSAPALCQMMGRDGARAMRLLVLGTWALPLTVIPVLWLLLGAGRFSEAVLAALTLAILVSVAIGAGLLARLWIGPLKPERKDQIDGGNALLLAVFVVALMPSIAQTWAQSPAQLMLWMTAAFIASFGVQWGLYRAFGSVDLAVVGGNRNMSLFLAALAGDTFAPALAFLGCYQIPMFLTPVLMPYVYGRKDQKPG